MLKAATNTHDDDDFIEVANDGSDGEDGAGHSQLLDAISQLDKAGGKKRYVVLLQLLS